MNGPSKPTLYEALYRICSLPAKTENPHEALEAVIDEITRILEATSASINLINPDSQALEIEVLRGLPEHSRQLQLSLGQGVTGWVALHGKPLLVPDVSQDARYFPVAEAIRSELAVPMRDRGRVIGVVNLDSDRENAFGEKELEILTLLTDEATKAISRIWVTNQLRSKAMQLQALVTTSQNLVARLEVGDLLQAIVEEGITLMGCKACALFMADPTGEVLRLSAVSGIRGFQGSNEELRLEESSIGTALKRRKQVEVPDIRYAEEHFFMDIVAREGLISMLGSPLMVEDQVLGVLCGYTAERHRFSNDERNLFMALSGMAALAIQNARLYQRVFESEEVLRRNERLTMLGLLSAEIAHEIRNPLTVIKLLFGSMELEFDAEDVRSRDVSIIAEKLDQLEGIVTRVLSFGKTNEDLHSRWSLHNLVEDTLHLVRLKLQQSGVHLVYQRPDQSTVVEGSKGQLQQALLNLIINATQAMPDGGTIEVRLQEEHLEQQQTAGIYVSDSGGGIPEELRTRVFDSFLTGHAKGTGLGLNIVKRIMKSHNGDVEITETGPSGTTMKLWLPCLNANGSRSGFGRKLEN